MYVVGEEPEYSVSISQDSGVRFDLNNSKQKKLILMTEGR